MATSPNERPTAGQAIEGTTMSITTLKKKLENPFALIAQGFLLGLILFGLTMPRESRADVGGQAVASAPDSQG